MQKQYRILQAILRRSRRAQAQFAAFMIAATSLVAEFPPGIIAGGLMWVVLSAWHSSKKNRSRWRTFSDLRGVQPEPYRLLLADYYYVKPHCMAALLAEHGIHSLILDEFLGAMRWKYARATGGVKLYVPVSDYDAAAALLVLQEPGADCPRCRYGGATYHRYWTGIAVATAILAVMLPLPHRRWRCPRCGYSWKELPESE